MLSTVCVNQKVAPHSAFVMTHILPVLSNGNSYFSLPHNSNAQLVIRISLPDILDKLFSLRMKNFSTNSRVYSAMPDVQVINLNMHK